MKILTMVALLACSGTLTTAAETASASLPRSQPEAQGIASAAILAFVDEAEKKIDALHSFMIVRHGHVVAEGWWSPYQRGISARALFALQELHLDGGGSGRSGREAECR